MNPLRPFGGTDLQHGSPPLLGLAVLALQQRLAELGYPCAAIGAAPLSRTTRGVVVGDIAGLLGPRTEAAIRAFQTRHGLYLDGVVGRDTWGTLFGHPPEPRPLPSPHADARDTDLGHLHPAVRGRVAAILDDLRAEGVPMGVFEAFRSPERQQALFAQGRNAAGTAVERGRIVTQARPFESYHQYGLAVDIVIQHPGTNPWDTGSAETRGWWAAMHAAAARHGMEPLSWEMPHVQLAGLSIPRLLRGEYPAGGDDGWAAPLAAAIARWPGRQKPPPPSQAIRPALVQIVAPPPAGSVQGWDGLPRVPDGDWTSRFGGQRWRVDPQGVHVEPEGSPPRRTLGAPDTCMDIVGRFGPLIQQAGRRHGVPPELIAMVIAIETGANRRSHYTGPDTFRWEAHIGDYSAGPMQILAGTARDVSARHALGYAPELFPHFNEEPQPRPAELPLYDPAMSIDIGACLIRALMDRDGADPILVAAAYNAGSLRDSDANPWHLHCWGDHLDRAAAWYGDACEVIGGLRG